MPARRRAAVAVAGALAFFLAVQLGALALVDPFQAAGYQQVEDPQNPANSLFYIAVLLVATGGMLLLFRFGRTSVLRIFLILTSGLISGYVFSVLIPPLPIAGGYGQTLLTAGGVGAVVLGLAVYPEWWVIDGTGLLVAMGAAALFGISFGILPAILLLGGLAIYDAVSVYGTEHMLTLASGIMELRVPVLIIIPTTTGYSFRAMADEMASEVSTSKSGQDETEATTSEAAESEAPDGPKDRDHDDPSEEIETEGSVEVEENSPDPLERDAFFIGLGDAVMPTIMVASAATFTDTPTVFGIEAAALGAIVGTVLGLGVLLQMVMRGKPHAGLPLLNSGAVGGYVLAAILSGIPLVEAVGLASVF